MLIEIFFGNFVVLFTVILLVYIIAAKDCKFEFAVEFTHCLIELGLEKEPPREDPYPIYNYRHSLRDSYDDGLYDDRIEPLRLIDAGYQ